jgi:hypothetical protein
MRPIRWPHGYRPSRNPLRRRCDRVEAAILGALLVVLAVAAPLAAIVVGHSVYHSATDARHTQLTTGHRVQAVLLTSAAWDPGGYFASAQARWTAPDGTRRTGTVFPAAGTPAGAEVQVWVDGSGRLTDEPLKPSQVQGQAVLAGVLAVMCVAVVLWGAGQAVRLAADRRRLAAWDDEWRATGPKWSRHG